MPLAMQLQPDAPDALCAGVLVGVGQLTVERAITFHSPRNLRLRASNPF